MKRNKGMLIVFMTPAVVMFAPVFLCPITRIILASFLKIEGTTDPMSKRTLSGIDNYVKLVNTILSCISMWDLARIWFTGGIIVISLALLFVTTAISGICFKSSFRAVIYLPNTISAVILTAMWLQYVYSPKYGLIKDSSQVLGPDPLVKMQWLDSDHKFMAPPSAYCFGTVGYHMLTFASSIECISDDYFEVVTLDGTNRLNQLRYIILSLLKGVLRINITMWSVISAGFFIWSQLPSAVTVDTQTTTPMVYLHMQIFGVGNSITERNFRVGTAVSVMLSICVVIVSWLCSHLLQDKDLES